MLKKIWAFVSKRQNMLKKINEGIQNGMRLGTCQITTEDSRQQIHFILQ
jgi:hypothetical protein